MPEPRPTRAKLRAVVVGAGAAAHAHARALEHHPGFEVTGVVDTAQQARTTGADVAVLCLQPAQNVAAAETLLAAGLHLLIERPLATSTIDCGRVVSAAQTAGRICAVTTAALAPAVRRVRAWLDAGHLGLPRSINVECLSGVDGLARAFVDAIDCARALTGCEPVEVFAEAGTASLETAVASVRFTHGVVASLVLGQVPVVPATAAASTTMRLIGSHGHVEVDAASPVVHHYSRDGQRQLPVDPAPLTAALDDLEASLRAGRPPAYDCRDAAIAVAVTVAAYESIATGMPVTVAADGPGSGST